MSMDHTSSHDRPGHETRDVFVRPIALISLAAASAALMFIVAMWFFIDFSAARQARESPPANPLAANFARKEPPEPRLQTHPVFDLESLRRHESELLQSYGWVDKSAGVVRIPIERAKQLVVQRGVGAAAGGRP